MIDGSVTNKGRRTTRAVIVSGVLFFFFFSLFQSADSRVAILSRSSEKRTLDRRLRKSKLIIIIYIVTSLLALDYM